MLTSASLVPVPLRRALAATLVMASCAAAPAASQASCVAPEPSLDAIDEASGATTAFIGVAREGETVNGGGPLVSPAIFDVQYRLGGRRTGATEQVATAVTSPTSFVSVGITPAAGEQWMLAGDPTAANPVINPGCTQFARRIDPTQAPVVTAKRVRRAAVLSDLRGRPIVAGAVAPRIPRSSRSLAAPNAIGMRLVHAGRITKLRERKGAWRLGTLHRGDRIFWIDANGLWAVRAS